jgi:UDP-N-acetylmuramoyl-L-alanyl-D-glutamate--2,6-diaminopimelate ligase
VNAVSRAMTLSALLDGIATVPAARDRVVTGLQLDSRRVHRGDAFIALRGGTRHGVEFAAAAVAAGAGGVIAEPPLPETPAGLGVIAVPGLRRQLGEIANRFYGAPSRGLTVIGITGTNGKTSSVQLVAQALTHAGMTVGTIGTLGAGLYGRHEPGERTTPDVITTHGLIAALRDHGATHLAMEVSSHALEQGRVDGVAFDVAVFTNLTRDHLDYHGTMQAYGAAKARLFRWPDLAGAVINRDDAFGRELLALPPSAPRVLSFSASGDPAADLGARAVRTSPAGIAFTLASPWGEHAIASPLLGRFNVDNLLTVAGSLLQLGWSMPRVAAALAQLTPVAGRMNRLGGDAATPLVVVDYAHTPDALEQALTSLRAHTSGRLLCVFGCGGERDAGKRPLMGAIAERLADRLIITDDNPRGEDGDAIVAAIRAGLVAPERAAIERDRARAIAVAVAEARAGDTVLIAGKGHETYQEVGGTTRPFDDLAEARRALGGGV